MPLGNLIIKLLLHPLLTLVELGARLRYTFIIGDELRSLWDVSLYIRCKHTNAAHQIRLLRCLLFDTRFVHFFLKLEVRLLEPPMLGFEVLIWRCGYA